MVEAESRRAFIGRLIPIKMLGRSTGQESNIAEIDGVFAPSILPPEPADMPSRRRLLTAAALSLAGHAVLSNMPKPVEAAAQRLTYDPPSNTPLQPPEENPTDKATGTEGNPLFIGAIDATYSYLVTRPPVVQFVERTGDNLSEMFGTQSGEYRDTAVRSLGLLGVVIAQTMMLSAFNAPSGNQGFEEGEFDELLRHRFFEILFEAGVMAPILEEGLFRLIPSLVTDAAGKINEGLRPKERICWPVGIPQSVLFGLVHNIRPDRKFAGSLPVQQTTSGLVQWAFMRQRGYTHAVLSHAVVNSTAITIGKALLPR